MGSYVHIYILPRKEITRTMVEAKMSLAVDWYRYDENLYIVYTTSSISKWQERLLEFVKDDGRLFICEINITGKNGWMNKAFWEWFKKERKK